MFTRKRKQKMHFKPRIVLLGDSSILIQLGEEIDLGVNQRVHALAGLIEASAIAGVIETVPAYATLLVHYDPLVLSFTQIKNILREKLTQIQENEYRKSRLIEVPVRYGGELGPDLDLVATHLGLRAEDVVRIHSEKIYT